MLERFAALSWQQVLLAACLADPAGYPRTRRCDRWCQSSGYGQKGLDRE